jgi:hypothetical protein
MSSVLGYVVIVLMWLALAIAVAALVAFTRLALRHQSLRSSEVQRALILCLSMTAVGLALSIYLSGLP